MGHGSLSLLSVVTIWGSFSNGKRRKLTDLIANSVEIETETMRLLKFIRE